MLRGRSSTGAQAPRACQTQGWGFRRKAPSLMAAGILGSPCLLLGNRSVRVRDPQAVAHTSYHTHCKVYRHTHTQPNIPSPTQRCVTSLTTQRLLSLLAPVIAQEEKRSEEGFLRAPHRTPEDIPLGNALFLHTGIRVLCSFIHPATFTKYAWTWPEDVLRE